MSWQKILDPGFLNELELDWSGLKKDQIGFARWFQPVLASFVRFSDTLVFLMYYLISILSFKKPSLFLMGGSLVEHCPSPAYSWTRNYAPCSRLYACLFCSSIGAPLTLHFLTKLVPCCCWLEKNFWPASGWSCSSLNLPFSFFLILKYHLHKRLKKMKWFSETIWTLPFQCQCSFGRIIE